MFYYPTTYAEKSPHANDEGIRFIYCEYCNSPLFKWQPHSGARSFILGDNNRMFSEIQYRYGRNIQIGCFRCQEVTWYQIPWRLWSVDEREWVDEIDD